MPLWHGQDLNFLCSYRVDPKFAFGTMADAEEKAKAEKLAAAKKRVRVLTITAFQAPRSSFLDEDANLHWFVG
jgi:hypothetical protein